MVVADFFWIISSYLLGSFPSGYLFSRFSGKDILKIGWRKTSGSNVFKNVGIWQGIATGIFDIGKGYLAVWGAQSLGMGLEAQALSGVVAVVGHNWSCFLHFAGGRGIGTLIGAFFALSPQILLFSLLPLIFLAAIWDAAIGTILFLITALSLSLALSQFNPVGIFILLSLGPIFAKRLSPLKEIYNCNQLDKPKAQYDSSQKNKMIFNRLIFDDDRNHWKLRIKKTKKI